jgi:hypothetical protein
MKNQEKKCAVHELRKIQQNIKNDSQDYNSHLIIGASQDENGFPEASVTMSTGKPMEIIGMVDVLIDQLKGIKKDIIKSITIPSKMSRKTTSKLTNTQFEKMVDNLPSAIADQIRDFKKRMDEAVDSQDDEKLKALKEEIKKMRNPFSSSKDNDDDDETPGFNINDFKGGMA